MKIIKFISVFVLLSFFYSGLLAQMDDNEAFEDFNKNVLSYDNALIVMVQTYDAHTKVQTRDDVFVAVTKKGGKEKTYKVKTPYYYVIADYSAFKDKYDLAAANEKRSLVKANADSVYVVSVDAGLPSGNKIEVVVSENKQAIYSQNSVEFPFHYSVECKTNYSAIYNPDAKPADKSGMKSINQ